ncbi:hypothetical protein E2562_036332 [Oryza meyeriana var. granulata]|uniref:Uncharacterized protein n=1 Tax=Oryza meyeriana var. granulata TaxID=110450 RepID=A0A6G1C9L6_9ORYZ|nr:hypothetical protein E2562_036332 [Oryza meyeriana var. granulata]
MTPVHSSSESPWLLPPGAHSWPLDQDLVVPVACESSSRTRHVINRKAVHPCAHIVRQPYMHVTLYDKEPNPAAGVPLACGP